MVALWLKTCGVVWCGDNAASSICKVRSLKALLHSLPVCWLLAWSVGAYLSAGSLVAWCQVSGVWCLVSGGGIVGKCLWLNTVGVVWCGDGGGASSIRKVSSLKALLWSVGLLVCGCLVGRSLSVCW